MRTGWRSARGRICLIKTFADVPCVGISLDARGLWPVRSTRDLERLHAFPFKIARDALGRIAPSGDAPLAIALWCRLHFCDSGGITRRGRARSAAQVRAARPAVAGNRRLADDRVVVGQLLAAADEPRRFDPDRLVDDFERAG